MLIALVLAVLLNGRAHDGQSPLDQVHACRVAHQPRRHVGEVVLFQGEYVTDHIERTLIRPIGCDRGIGVGQMTSVAEAVIAAADRPNAYPGGRKIVATFEAQLVQTEPNGFQYFHDSGVRLDVTSVRDLQIIDAEPPPPKAPPLPGLHG